jgi:hypothetical protein
MFVKVKPTEILSRPVSGGLLNQTNVLTLVQAGIIIALVYHNFHSLILSLPSQAAARLASMQFGRTKFVPKFSVIAFKLMLRHLGQLFFIYQVSTNYVLFCGE